MTEVTMDKDDVIEQLKFENKMLSCENEYIKRNLETLKKAKTVSDAEANSRVISFMLKVRRRLRG